MKKTSRIMFCITEPKKKKVKGMGGKKWTESMFDLTIHYFLRKKQNKRIADKCFQSTCQVCRLRKCVPITCLLFPDWVNVGIRAQQIPDKLLHRLLFVSESFCGLFSASLNYYYNFVCISGSHSGCFWKVWKSKWYIKLHFWKIEFKH